MLSVEELWHNNERYVVEADGIFPPFRGLGTVCVCRIGAKAKGENQEICEREREHPKRESKHSRDYVGA